MNFLKLRFKSLWVGGAAAALIALPLIGFVLKVSGMGIKLGFHDGDW